MIGVQAFEFRSRPPRAELAGCVDKLWYAKGHSPYTDIIFPTAQMSLLVNLGDPQKIVCASNLAVQPRDAWVIGQQRGVLRNTPTGLTHVVGATFHIHGAGALLAPACAELTDRVVELGELWGPLARQLRERLGELSCPSQMLDVLEQTLLIQQRQPPRLRQVGWAARALTGDDPLSVAEVCREMGRSNKSLVAAFRQFVGISPKAVARQARLLRVLRALDGPRPLAEVALGNGFCDQAHLNREFRRVCGMTPGEFMRRRQTSYGGRETGQTPQFLSG